MDIHPGLTVCVLTTIIMQEAVPVLNLCVCNDCCILTCCQVAYSQINKVIYKIGFFFCKLIKYTTVTHAICVYVYKFIYSELNVLNR